VNGELGSSGLRQGFLFKGSGPGSWTEPSELLWCCQRAGGEGRVCGGSHWGPKWWSTSVRLRRLTTELVEAWYIWGLSWAGTTLGRTEIPGIRGIHKAQVNNSYQPGHPGDGQAGGPKWIGQLGFARVARGGLRVAVVGFGRIGEEGSVDRQLFRVGGGPFTGNSECLKRGSEMGHPSPWELF